MKTRISLITIAALFIAACDSDDPTPFAPPPANLPQGTAQIQALHASSDAPRVNIVGLTAPPISDVDYKDGTGAVEISEGLYRGVQVDGILPDGSTTTVIGPVDLDIAPDTLYSILAIGELANIEPLILTQPTDPVPAGSTRLRVVHGAPAVDAVSVFLTAPNADLQAEAPVGTFMFGEDLGPVEVAAGGPYQIRITLPFTPPEVPVVAFDSGEITLPDGGNLLITAVPNTTTGASPVTLSVLDGTGSSEILHIATPAQLRVLHASADTPAVDIIVNGDLANPLISDLSYTEFEPMMGFLSVPADTYDISVTDSATQSVFPIVLDDVPLDAGITYDVFAVNEFVQVEADILTDDFRPLATAAKVRIYHASTLAQSLSPNGVDIYVQPVNGDGSAVDINDVDPTITEFEFKDNTGFIELAAGEYDVTVTTEGSKMPAIGPARIDVDALGIYTAIARDPNPAVPNDGLGLILMDDFVTP